MSQQPYRSCSLTVVLRKLLSPPSLLLIPPPSDITPLYSVFRIFSLLWGFILAVGSLRDFTAAGFHITPGSATGQGHRPGSPSPPPIRNDVSVLFSVVLFTFPGMFPMLCVRLRPENARIGWDERRSRGAAGVQALLTHSLLLLCHADALTHQRSHQ